MYLDTTIYFAIGWRWTLPMYSSSHIEMRDLMSLQDVVFGALLKHFLTQ